jgi:hypothetical protein
MGVPAQDNQDIHKLRQTRLITHMWVQQEVTLILVLLVFLLAVNQIISSQKVVGVVAKQIAQLHMELLVDLLVVVGMVKTTHKQQINLEQIQVLLQQIMDIKVVGD